MKHYDNRKFVIIAIFIFIFIVIWVKLFHLQLINQSFKISSENNSRRKTVVYPIRGLIYDREGELIVSNELAYDMYIIPNNMEEFDTLSLCNHLNITKEEFDKKLEACIKYSKHRPSVFYKQISMGQYAVLQEYMYKYPGFFVQDRTVRRYNKDIAAHILGNVGEVNIEELRSDNYYAARDYIGKNGIEKYYEEQLRGEKGLTIQLVDVQGNIRESYAQGKYDTLAIPGKDIVLTIDAKLQEYGEKLLKNKKGSIVAIDPATGEILALVSSPTYSSSLLVGRHRGHNYDSLLKISDKPFLNRAVTSTYPPGSIFKMAQALLALQDGVLDPNQCYLCNKSLVGCHSHPPTTSVAKALQYSCNPYFYHVFKNLIQQGKEKSIFRDSRLGLVKWEENILDLGFNKRFDIGIPNVSKGFVPNADFYDRLYGKYRWAFSTIYSLSIGQGELLMSPLQMANFCAIIANRGYYIEPYLVKSVGGVDAQCVERKQTHTPFNKDYFEIIIEGMFDVVNEKRGTGLNAYSKEISICGKTGTIENPHGKDHAAFIALAPRNNPQIVISVYLENVGFGGVWAAPIAKLMIEKYLKVEEIDKELENRILGIEFIENNE